ncbi:enoyl-CoA hydratase/isomerase family protein [Limnohabitans sp.]|uniref:enoyl-CoA hydratase/isomerase family protein n=1 Tax=Limnohabitans sp. TaxID=1907725 RepID=UPI00286F3374|nr:enoyl-CoA hydratase/isomerase family protein [Limnohabitans sp.]
MYKTLKIEYQERVATIWMNRPDVFNAFDEHLIADLHSACQVLDADTSVRVVVLGGMGKNFSAGADLNWMKRASTFGKEENLADARIFANMLHTLSCLSKPTIARIQGAALGGGTGLAAACDIAISTSDAVFATSEVKFGIIPAVISPYVLRAIGQRHALRYFQTGEKFTATRAHEIGLVTEVCSSDELDTKVKELANLLISGAPLAQKAAKDLIAAISDRRIDHTICEETAQRISRQRATNEAKDGISSFLEKRTPAWLI